MKFSTIFTPDQALLAEELKERDEAQRREPPLDPSDPGRLKAVSRPVAEFLLMAVLHRRAQHIAEFGTSHGYSTLFLAAAAERTDGRVYTVDRMPEKTATTRANLERVGLEHRVEFHTGEGADFVQQLPEDLDFILLDFGPGSLGRDLAEFKGKFAPGCLMFADGGPPGTWRDQGDFQYFRESFEEDPNFMAAAMVLIKEHLTAVRL